MIMKKNINIYSLYITWYNYLKQNHTDTYMIIKKFTYYDVYSITIFNI